MKPLRFALIGAGFWSKFQLAAWREIDGVECVAICDRARERAVCLAAAAGVPAAYSDARELLLSESLDFVDIVTNPESNSEIVALAAGHRLPAVCQKPMAPSLQEAIRMKEVCQAAGVALYVHENWRWQTPIRQLGRILESGVIGTPFRARIRMASGFSVFENQPLLRNAERFLIADIGSHVLDVARFLFGEALTVYAQTGRIQQGIRGEDVATVILRTALNATVICEMGYAGAPLGKDSFPQTFVLVEGNQGSIELESDYRISVTTAAGTDSQRFAPPLYSWADRDYAIVHASIVPCQENILAGLRGQRQPETTAEDNYKTMQLVFAAYDSAQSGEVVHL